MKFNGLIFAAAPIFAAATLLFLPDFCLLPPHLSLILNLSLILTALFGAICRFRRLARASIYAAVFALCLGIAHWQALARLNDAEAAARLPPRLHAELHIEEILHDGAYQTLIADARFALPDRPRYRLLIHWKADSRPQNGEIWQAEISPKALSARLNMDGFDRQKWYFFKRIAAKATVKRANRMGERPTWRQRWLNAVRQQTAHLPQQGLLLALAFGERAWLTADTADAYRRTNTAHLLAISGLHIGLVAAWGMMLCRWGQRCPPARHITPWLPLFGGLTAALGYAYLAGFSLPTLRAAVAVLIAVGVRRWRRHYSPFRLFYWVIALLLLGDPFMPLSVGFWLSAGAVGSLLLWYRFFPLRLVNWRNQPLSTLKVRWIFSLFHLQLGLLVLFTPVQFLLFDGIALNGLVANLIAVPLFSLILVPLVLLALLLSLCSLVAAADVVWQAADATARYLTDLIATLPPAWLPLSVNSSLILTALFALLALGLLGWRVRQTRPTTQTAPPPSLYAKWRKQQGLAWAFVPLNVRHARYAAYGLVAIMLLCGGRWGVRQWQAADWQVDTLDVGQGLATLIVKNGKGILYDTGAAWQGGSMAEMEILPYLQRQGIVLDTLILSHDDNDHAGGAASILAAFPDIALITPSQHKFAQNASKTDRTLCRKGVVWHWQGLDFRVLSPPMPAVRAENADSCVIVAGDERHNILLTGDADQRTERQFAADVGNITLLQVGHHGSKTSTGDLLLRLTQPQMAVVSSGRHNPWHFPHADVTQRLQRHGVSVFNTAEVGQIRLAFKGETVTLSTARTPFSPWYARVIGLSPQ